MNYNKNKKPTSTRFPFGQIVYDGVSDGGVVRLARLLPEGRDADRGEAAESRRRRILIFLTYILERSWHAGL